MNWAASYPRILDRSGSTSSKPWDDDLDRIFTDPTDRLEAMAHRWALETAGPVRLLASRADLASGVVTAREDLDGREARALVAMPGPWSR